MLPRFCAPLIRRGACLLLIAAAVAVGPAATEAKPFLPNNQVQSTMPQNGDVNPYGVVFVPQGFPTTGVVLPGDLLISNFNNANNLQGTGTSIVQLRLGTIQPPTMATQFAQTGPGPGLALGIVKAGFVVQGLTGTTDGTFGTIQSGGLVFFDPNGAVKTTFTGVTAPWGLAINDKTAAGTGGFANIFVSNLNPGLVTNPNGAAVGTVTRLDFRFISIRGGPIGIMLNKTTTIASGYVVQPNQGALVLGPAGLAYDAENDILYVASQADNAIYAIPRAAATNTSVAGNAPGTLITQNGRLRAPTGLMLGPNGDLLTANNDAVNPSPANPSEIVEINPAGGGFVRQMNVDQAIAGAFGLGFGTGFGTSGNQLRFAFVDDNTVTATIFSCPAAGC